MQIPGSTIYQHLRMDTLQQLFIGTVPTAVLPVTGLDAYQQSQIHIQEFPCKDKVEVCKSPSPAVQVVRDSDPSTLFRMPSLSTNSARTTPEGPSLLS